MLEVERREQIRRAYYVEKKSMRQISSELGHSYWTIRDALDNAGPRAYRLSAPKRAPVLGLYKRAEQTNQEDSPEGLREGWRSRGYDFDFKLLFGFRP